MTLGYRFVTAVVKDEIVERIWAQIEEQPGVKIVVDLDARDVRCGSVHSQFQIDDYTRWRLMEGLDDIAITLQKSDEIESFENSRDQWRPTTLPARSQ